LGLRAAQPEDLDKLLELVKQFNKEVIEEFGIFTNDELARSVITKCIPTSFVLEHKRELVGVIGGVKTTFPLNQEVMYHELIWYVLPEHRSQGLRLYTKLEQY